jgi:hypothetical protein
MNTIKTKLHSSCCNAVSPVEVWPVDMVVPIVVVEKLGIVIPSVESEKTPTKQFASTILRLTQPRLERQNFYKRRQHCKSEMESLVCFVVAVFAALFNSSFFQTFLEF